MNKRPDVGQVWEHRRDGITQEVHLILESRVNRGTVQYRLLNLLVGTVHPNVLIGPSDDPEFGWQKVS